MTTLPAGCELGAWVWADEAAAVPAGLLADHGDHHMVVAWAGLPGEAAHGVFTLDSLVPLTVVERVLCGLCGREGRIVDGVWVETKGDV